MIGSSVLCKTSCTPTVIYYSPIYSQLENTRPTGTNSSTNNKTHRLHCASSLTALSIYSEKVFLCPPAKYERNRRYSPLHWLRVFLDAFSFLKKYTVKIGVFCVALIADLCCVCSKRSDSRPPLLLDLTVLTFAR
jgi:hypothetical protein